MQQQINIQSQLGNASREDFQEANARYDAIRPYLATRHSEASVYPSGTPSVRSRRRWIVAYEAAEQEYGCGYIGLLPSENLGGIDCRRCLRGPRAKMVEFIDQEFESIRNEGVLKLGADVWPSAMQSRRRSIRHRGQLSLGLFASGRGGNKRSSVKENGLHTLTNPFIGA